MQHPIIGRRCIFLHIMQHLAVAVHLHLLATQHLVVGNIAYAHLGAELAYTHSLKLLAGIFHPLSPGQFFFFIRLFFKIPRPSVSLYTTTRNGRE